MKSISICSGDGCLRHNNRDFYSKNVDPTRTANNIQFVKESVRDAYSRCFGEALERYNERQTRKDRRIDDYYKHLFHCDYTPTTVSSNGAKNSKRSFYELVVQVGKMEDSGIDTADWEVVASCLTDYMKGFQERNPNMYVFNAVLHLDEATPHLHIDYIPIGHCTRGLDTQNALGQALREMGYSDSPTSIVEWYSDERAVLTEICNSRGIEISEPKPSRGVSFTVDEYKEYKDKINGYKDQVNKAKSELAEITSTLKAVETEIPELRTKLKAQRLLAMCEGNLSDKPQPAGAQSVILSMGNMGRGVNPNNKNRGY